MLRSKSLILAALALLLPAVVVQSYSVIVHYDMVEDGDCTAYSPRMTRAANIGLYQAGMIGAGNENHWDTYAYLHDKLTRIENKIDRVEERYNHATKDNERRLCGTRCWFFCQHGFGKWCECCTCCGNRRRLGTSGGGYLRKLDVDPDASDEELDAKEEEAEEAVLAELNRFHEHIPCLAYPYTVTVDFVEENEEPDEYATKEEARLAKKAANRAKRAANKAAKQNLREQLKISRAILKAARTELAKARKAVKVAVKRDLAAEEAVKLEGIAKAEEEEETGAPTGAP